MRIALGADHAGVTLKNDIKAMLEERGLEVLDLGTETRESVDYPDFAAAVGRAVAGGQADRGILCCGSGLGMAMAANKVPGIRAAPIVDLMSAKLCREHNDANVLALGERLTAAPLARAIVDVFLNTPFAGGRHTGRVAKINALDHP